MRVCIFSDTHGNLVALDAVLADMRQQGAFDLLVMAGDLAMFGPRPAETIDRLRALDCLVLMGNTDAYVVEQAGQSPRDGDPRAAYGIAEWTAQDGWRLDHRRVAYDVDAVVADMRTSGMPDAEKQIEILKSARY